MERAEIRKKTKESYARRYCLVCGEAVQDGEGIYWMELRIFTHRDGRGTCAQIVHSLRCDYTHSRRGKLRPILAVIEDIIERMDAHAHL